MTRDTAWGAAATEKRKRNKAMWKAGYRWHAGKGERFSEPLADAEEQRSAAVDAFWHDRDATNETSLLKRTGRVGSHALPGKPRKFNVYWIATDGAMDRHINGDMCELAAEKVAGALRDLMTDDECGRGTYLHGTSTDNAVAQTGWSPADYA